MLRGLSPSLQLGAERRLAVALLHVRQPVDERRRQHLLGRREARPALAEPAREANDLLRAQPHRVGHRYLHGFTPARTYSDHPRLRLRSISCALDGIITGRTDKWIPGGKTT